MLRVVATSKHAGREQISPRLLMRLAMKIGVVRNDIIRATSAETMRAMRLIWAAIGLSVGMALATCSAQTAGPWSQPATALTGQIVGILGPGQARLTIRNISGISNDAIPAIRKLLEQDLKAHGVTVAGDESANSIRVTLSENAHERIWVAEVVEGNVTQAAMVEALESARRSANRFLRLLESLDILPVGWRGL